jgi:hypothetical protein
MAFADQTSSIQTRTATNLSATEKCSWLLRATKDAPSFKVTTSASEITSSSLDTSYSIHYVEYDNNVIREASSDWIKYDNTGISNVVKGTFYDQTEFSGQEYAFAYQIMNPSDNIVYWKKRWFPAAMVG